MAWIKVGIAPEVNTPVLVTHKIGGEHIAQSVAILDEDGDWRWWQYEDDDYKQNPKVSDLVKIIAWQPLPKPYPGENDADREDIIESIITFSYMTLGNLNPTGKEPYDKRVQVCIEHLGEVVYELTDRLCQIANNYRDSIWPSERQCASTAQEYINDLKELYKEV